MMTLNQIQEADYSTLVGWIKERNRPSGGIRTIAEFGVKAFINSQKKVLEVGSNTGFSMCNLAALTGAYCIGIDLNENSIAESQKYAAEMGVSDKVEFMLGNALNIPFEKNTFDALWVSNVTSFIAEKRKAIAEYLRVLKPNGVIGFAPIYYFSPPPAELLHEVEQLVGTEINIRTLEDWKKEILSAGNYSNWELVEYSVSNFRYYNQEYRISEWIDKVLAKPHLSELAPELCAALADRYRHCMTVFNENLKYCGYSIILFQKRMIKEEPELFLTYNHYQ